LVLYSFSKCYRFSRLWMLANVITDVSIWQEAPSDYLRLEIYSFRPPTEETGHKAYLAPAWATNLRIRN
jgi:hypothetical protein